MKEKYPLILMPISILLFVLFSGFSKQAGTVYQSSYVTLSPDRQAFTVNDRDKNWEHYPNGTSIFTGIQSSVRALNIGEHYFKSKRNGNAPVGRWTVKHQYAQCIHINYQKEELFHGVSFGRSHCLAYYYSGWNAYCADCGDLLEYPLIYMSDDAARSITVLNLDLDYYYLCPFCNNLEQGSSLGEHFCKEISWNQYRVQYVSNSIDTIGLMPQSIHMYNNATTYEGIAITPATRLTKNAYTRVGYEFIGWNTKPDGSGQVFHDGQEIWNLTDEDFEDGVSGLVTLYAQWKHSESTLQIDPGGGSYDGNGGISSFQNTFRSQQFINLSLLKSPMGYTVTFHTMGGRAINAITGTTSFREWRMSYPFYGDFRNHTYTYLGKDNAIDTITALYTPNSIVLPIATKDGSSFGGWYYDLNCTNPAGGAGESFTPTRNITLYAKWVELVLVATSDYTANDGKGAVNLSWSQNDGNLKTYRLYQSPDNISWKQISDVSDIGDPQAVNHTYSYIGDKQTYTIPYTGFYTLTAYGAQGENYGINRGGLGGMAQGTFWLTKGEVLTYDIGGQDGYNGGGIAILYGNGGGATTVSTDRKGVLLIAGGGGGASATGSGGEGGSHRNTISGSIGGSGQAGGGGGYLGGVGSMLLYHTHVVGTCSQHYHTPQGQVGCWEEVEQWHTGVRQLITTGGGWDGNGNGMCDQCNERRSASHGSYGHWHTTHYGVYWDEETRTEGCTTCGRKGGPGALSGTCCVCGQTESGNPDHQHGVHIYVKTYCTVCNVELTGDDATYQRHRIASTWNLICTIPEGAWSCGKDTNFVESATDSYGGSNFIATSVISSQEKAGQKSGNGAFTIISNQIGYLDTLSLDGVAAPDLAPPCAIDPTTVSKTALSAEQIRITFQEPIDNGTAYYHRVESYLLGSTQKRSDSNTTINTLISGIKGYYYLIDTYATTSITGRTSGYLPQTPTPVIDLTLTDTTRYLHLAAVDVAGNISSTIHILISKQDDDVAWELCTDQITIASGGNVYPANVANTYYVKSDGETPFTLSFTGSMQGNATNQYQINYSTFHARYGLMEQWFRLHTPSHSISQGEGVTIYGVMIREEGTSILQNAGYNTTTRDHTNRNLTATQRFVLPLDFSSQTIQITPIVGADFQNTIVTSNWEKDILHSVTLIADGEAPIITGGEELETLEILDRNAGDVILQYAAQDAGSGVRDFYVEIINHDNMITNRYTADSDGKIRITITKDEPIFSGHFTVTATATDNVGNSQSKSQGTTEFSLTANVTRILSPHEPIFKRGESGNLEIIAYGYVDRIEVIFPTEMTDQNPDLNTIFVYQDTPSYIQRETLEFMVPLNMQDDGELIITVKAYKDGKEIEAFPSLNVIKVEGTVLDEIRTRLR
ncbi:MAG: InlB B-repeat-containing protein [Clostridium sp.]|jgi:hypothetical protein|nr:InlB B-repeat-containing protein [Clostridium sp.]